MTALVAAELRRLHATRLWRPALITALLRGGGLVTLIGLIPASAVRGHTVLIVERSPQFTGLWCVAPGSEGLKV